MGSELEPEDIRELWDPSPSFHDREVVTCAMLVAHACASVRMGTSLCRFTMSQLGEEALSLFDC